jgi:hypothetical protein
MPAEPQANLGELQAILLATGENKRLAALSEALPPALVPVEAPR